MSAASGLRVVAVGEDDAALQTSVATSARLTRWLLNPGVQLAYGRHAGGVAGSLGPSGDADYLYPEITGYYLQWLAWRAYGGGDPAMLVPRAVAAQRWLRAWAVGADLPPTRIHLRAHARDWRNDTVFFFDLAMVARGLASVVRQRLVQPDAPLIDALAVALSKLVAADGRFVACAPVGDSIPERWSTRRGGFLAKAAAGLLSAARALPALCDLVPAATATFRDSVEHGLQAPHDEMHPFFYGVEGIAARIGTLTPQQRSAVAAQVCDRLARVDADGTLAESMAGSGPRRCDVAAQALRAAVLLAVDRGEAGIGRALAQLQRRLHPSVDARGAVPFACHDTARGNVWATMFTHQALEWCNAAPVPHLIV